MISKVEEDRRAAISIIDAGGEEVSYNIIYIM